MGGAGEWLRTRTRNASRIAYWEVTKNAGGVDRRTLAVALLALVGLGALAPLAVSHGVALDKGIYRVGATEEDPYYEPAFFDPTFRIQEPSFAAVRADQQEVLVRGTQVREYARTQKGRAAVAELRSTVDSYNDRLMRAEDKQTAAYPGTAAATEGGAATARAATGRVAPPNRPVTRTARTSGGRVSPPG